MHPKYTPAANEFMSVLYECASGRTKKAGLYDDFMVAAGSEKHRRVQNMRDRAKRYGLGLGSALAARTVQHLGDDEESAAKFLQDNRQFSVNSSKDPLMAAAELKHKDPRLSILHLGDSMAKKPGVVAHEWGHAANHLDSPTVRALQRYSHPMINSPLAFLTGHAAGVARSKTDDATLRKALKYLPSAPGVPIVVYEAAATGRGLHQLAQQQGGRAALKGLAPTLPALATYVSGAVSPVVYGDTVYNKAIQKQPLGRRMLHFAQDNAGELKSVGGRVLGGAGLLGAAGLAAYAAHRHSKRDKEKTAASARSPIAKKLLGHLTKHDHAYDVAGLGILGAIGADRLQAHARAGMGATNHDIEKKQLLGESGHAMLDTVGLGVLAAPVIAHMAKGH